jgi:hypothetical protein
MVIGMDRSRSLDGSVSGDDQLGDYDDALSASEKIMEKIDRCMSMTFIIEHQIYPFVHLSISMTM